MTGVIVASDGTKLIDRALLQNMALKLILIDDRWCRKFIRPSCGFCLVSFELIDLTSTDVSALQLVNLLTRILKLINFFFNFYKLTRQINNSLVEDAKHLTGRELHNSDLSWNLACDKNVMVLLNLNHKNRLCRVDEVVTDLEFLDLLELDRAQCWVDDGLALSSTRLSALLLIVLKWVQHSSSILIYRDQVLATNVDAWELSNLTHQEWLRVLIEGGFLIAECFFLFFAVETKFKIRIIIKYFGLARKLEFHKSFCLSFHDEAFSIINNHKQDVLLVRKWKPDMLNALASSLISNLNWKVNFLRFNSVKAVPETNYVI